VWIIKNFRPYLYGLKFIVVTDHRPLTWLFGINDPSSRLMRWWLGMDRAGSNNNADALSRIEYRNGSNNIETILKISDTSYEDYIEECNTKIILSLNINITITKECIITATNSIILFFNYGNYDKQFTYIVNKYKHWI